MIAGLSAADILRWFPDSPYYREHAERLAYSFGNLPELPPGFSCLSIGSYGDEAPFLIRKMGAGRVVAIRSPAAGVPKRELRTVTGANGERSDVDLWAFDLEGKEDFPMALRGYDLVLMWEVLEHMCLDPALALFRAIQAVKDGGTLSLTTPNALWHVFTVAQLYGTNALGLKLQHHIPFATHWRLYSAAEAAELCNSMGCETTRLTTFLRERPFSWKSRLALTVLKLLRRKSGNGECSYGQHIYLLARKVLEKEVVRPEWLYPGTVDTSGCEIAADTCSQS